MPLNSIRVFTIVVIASAVLLPNAFAGQAGPNSPKEQTVPELVNIARNNPLPEAKAGAIRKLAVVNENDERNNSVTELLIEITGKTTDYVIAKECTRALMALYKNGISRTKVKFLEPFTALLKEPKSLPAVRSGIASLFMETLDKEGLKDKKAFDVIVEIAKNKREDNVALRCECVKAIGTFGMAESIGMLCDLLSDTEPAIREAAAKAITLLLDKDMTAGAGINLAGVNKLIDMMRDETLDDSLRIIVIRAVSQLMAAGAPGANRGLEDIIKLVKTATKDPIVAACIEGLGIVGTAQAAEPLIGTYNDYFDAANPTKEKDWPVRQKVAQALRSLLSVQANKPNPELPVVKSVTALLIKMIDADPVTAVKESAVLAIGYVAPKKFEAEHKEATAALIFLLEKSTTEQNLKTLIIDALENITRTNPGGTAERWKKWWQDKYRANLQ